MEYKGYTAVVEYEDDASVLFGYVIDTRDVITFEGENVQELRESFHHAVDDYLELCASRGEEPEKPFSGKFVVRVDPTLHRKVYTAATRAGKSLNAWIAEALEREAG